MKRFRNSACYISVFFTKASTGLSNTVFYTFVVGMENSNKGVGGEASRHPLLFKQPGQLVFRAREEKTSF